MRSCFLSLFSVAALAAIPSSAEAQAYVPHGQQIAPASVAIPAAPASPGYGAAEERPTLMVDPDRRLQQGDQLSFSIEEDHDPAMPLVVGATGDVRIEPLCAVHVAGLTVDGARDAIKRRLEADYYKHATIRLTLERANQNFALGFVYLSGEIAKVGGLPLFADHPMTLSQAVTNAGGLGTYGDGRKVRVTRTTKGGGSEVIVKDVKAILQSGRRDLDMTLQDGDQIFVPRVWAKF
jgi:protein involved in polysaccharide export with SLBB domain